MLGRCCCAHEFAACARCVACAPACCLCSSHARPLVPRPSCCLVPPCLCLMARRILQIAYEAYGPGGTGFIVFCLTDNVNRTASEASPVQRGG